MLDPFPHTIPHSRTHRNEIRMSNIRQPQDHNPQSGPAKFTFEAPVTDASGKTTVKTFTLPLATKGRSKLSGRELRDAALGGEAGQVTYMFKVLEAAEPSRAALDALYDMPADDMLDVMKAWGDFGDGDGASLGK